MINNGLPVRTYIGLGSNLDQPVQQVMNALEKLAKLPMTRLLAQSSMYRNPPMGPVPQPDFVNAIAALETCLSPNDLLAELQHIEYSQGRVRHERWGPRTIDLDLLLYAECIVDEPHLRIPHPAMHERSFVLYPLAEIAADLVIPGKGPLARYLAECSSNNLVKLHSG